MAFHWLSGLLNALAAGTLLHVGVQMVGGHVGSAHAAEPRQRVLAVLQLKALHLCFGALLMSVLAIWA